MVRMMVAVGVLAALLGGCGGKAQRSVRSVSKTPTIVQPGAQPGSLSAVKQRLEAAGYSAEQGASHGNVVQQLEVDGVVIASYRTESAAAADYKGVSAVFNEHPDRGVIRLAGARLYWFAEERPLTQAERARFERIVKIGQQSP